MSKTMMCKLIETTGKAIKCIRKLDYQIYETKDES
jgi:hypothetical protein